MTTKAVIMARGLGTRMRRADGAIELSAEQATAADAGAKALVSVGRPFIDYVLAALAEAGLSQVCLVIGPEHEALRAHCAALPLERLSIDFAIQESPRGTADAVRSARAFVGDDPFLILNSDNYYSSGSLRCLVALEEPGLIGFSPEGLARGNIEPERVRQFAIIDSGANGRLRRIVEKPTADEWRLFGGAGLVSMNCWRFEPTIFAACDAIGPSPRGELELTAAVQYGIDRLGISWRVIPRDEPVWDLTSRRDIAALSEAFANVETRF